MTNQLDELLTKNHSLIEKGKRIKCLITDLDGVLTDGRLSLDDTGNEIKSFHVHDGMGLKLLTCAGFEVAVITTSRAPLIDHRMQQLGIKHYFKGQVSKEAAFLSLKKQLQLDDAEIAYVGDDLPDIPLIRLAGLGIAVANALDAVKEAADYITEKQGGFGAVREICDFLLTVNQLQDKALKRYFAS